MAENKAKKTLADTKAEITGAPVTAPKPAIKPVEARPIQAKLNTQSVSDPIQMALEKRELNGCVYIDNSGRGVLRERNHYFEINDIYATKADKDAENGESAKNALTGLTDAQSQFLCIFQLYHPKETVPIIQRQSAIHPPAGHSVGFTLTGKNNTNFTAILDTSGQVAYYDTGKSCVMPAAVLAATAPAARDDDLIDAGQNFNIKYNIDKDGKITPKTAEESALALTLARMENKATKVPSQLDMLERITDQVVREATENTLRKDITKGGVFSSSVDTGIKSEFRPSTSFEDIILGAPKHNPNNSIMFKEIKNTPTEASNDPRLKLEA